MRLAEELARRSTCRRRSVGAVITSGDLTRVLGVGYNGGAKGGLHRDGQVGFPNP
jgi:deoxycytidylate deaminase